MTSERPQQPVPPEGMEILFFYRCPQCGRPLPVVAATEAKLVTCEVCGCRFPIIPVEEHVLHYMRIMLAGGRAAADPDFL